MGKKYIVSEKVLRELLYDQMWRTCLDRDGVDDWEWCGESYSEVVQEYAPEGMDLRGNTTFDEVARARLASGEFEEI